jgi:ABC-type transport system involved in cytochrome c biogenesis permease subunit
MKPEKLFPWLAGILALLAAVVMALPAGKVRGLDIESFARIPVLEGGRVKPLDSVARNSLLMIRSQQSFRFNGRTVGADEWMLDAMCRPEVADTQPIFVINDPEVLGLMGMQQTNNRYFSFAAMRPYLGEIEKQAQAAGPVDSKQRTRFQSAIVNLYDRMYLYHRLKNTLQIEGSAGLSAELLGIGGADPGQRYQAMAQFAVFRPLAPPPGQNPDGWQSVGEALHVAPTGPARHPALAPLARITGAYAAQDAGAFNQALAEFRGLGNAIRPEAQAQADNERLFNRADPFTVGMMIYVFALLTLFVSWIWKREILQPSALALLVAGCIVHTLGLAFRIILQGRPPVTNLYSSAVFVGWGVVVLGIVLERMYRKGFATAVAAAAGFASLIIAHHLAQDGDTMEMMRAVLDSNFWLATHVVTITIGYSGTFLAGSIAIGYTLWKHLARNPDPETASSLVGMAYGIVCFSLLFSFVGTVLGGIWADQSWGRFWGWDPKENGALLIVLWNAIILHARWGGFARERGIMAMAIFGNIITSLSWFGVNMLGVGLHSYGFMDKAFAWLSAFIASQFILIGFCLLPKGFWAGNETRKA